jgi:hypothetical protein
MLVISASAAFKIILAQPRDAVGKRNPVNLRCLLA